MSYCPIINKDNKLFVQPSEVCGFTALERMRGFNYGEFNSNGKYYYNSNTIFPNANILGTDFNYNYRDPYSNEYIYQYDKNKKDLCYQIGNNNWALNCAIEHQNPLYTYNSQTKSCGLIPNISLPSGFKIGKEKKKSYLYFESDNKDVPTYAYKDKKAFCENKWFDWMTTPNYHFGNQYEKDSGVYSKEDVRKCYKPCGLGYMPYFTTDNKYICIPKSEASDGIYANKLDFSPVALINLIGNSRETLDILHKSLLLDKYITYKDHPDIETNFYINSNLMYNGDKKENNIGIDAIKNSIATNLINKNIINIPIINNPTVISYKNPNFTETDQELLTLRGMAGTEMLSDPILIHTFLLAIYYKDFITTYVSSYNNYFKSDDSEKKTVIFDNIKNHKFNLKFNMDNLFGDDYDYNQNKDKYLQRLANLLYKAINICYDNKTDFSKNFIIYTERAFKNYYHILKGEVVSRRIFGTPPADFYNFAYNQNTKFELEVPFLESEIMDNNDYLFTYIESNFNFDRNRALISTPKLNDNINKDKIKVFYSPTKDKQVFFYTKEDSERINDCKSGEILDGNKKCMSCGEVCNKDTCKTNPRCAYFCDDVCSEIDDKERESGGRCGDKKKAVEKKEKEDRNEIKDPIDESYTIPDFTTIFKSAIKIFFALIILYMCYIFYQIYGETITTLINLIIYNIYNFADWFKLLFKSNVNEYQHEFNMKDYIRANASSKYEKVVNKLKTPIISS
jgi:hypothetical protein